MHFSKRFKIGVFGSAAGKEVDEKLRISARLIGQQIAEAHCILVTGACPGLPHEAALGADDVGGLVLGFSPAMNLADHINNFHFPVYPYGDCRQLSRRRRLKKRPSGRRVMHILT